MGNGIPNQNRTILLVCIGGALGGFFSWVYSIYLGQPLPLPWWGAVPTSLALGALASWVGVFVIANTDRSDINRLFGLAVLFGLSWKPVLEAGKAYITQLPQTSADHKISMLVQDSENLNKELGSVGSNLRAEKVEEIKDATVVLTGLILQTDNKNTKEVALNQIEANVKALDTLPGKEGVGAISEIGKAGLKAGESQIALQAITALQERSIATKDTAILNEIEAIGKVAQEKELPHVVIISKYKQADATLEIAKHYQTIRDTGAINGLKQRLMAARADYASAENYYRATNDTSGVYVINAKLHELNNLIRP